MKDIPIYSVQFNTPPGFETRFEKGKVPPCGVMFKKGYTPWNKGRKGLFHHTEEAKAKIKAALTHRKPWNYGLATHINTGYEHFVNGRRYCTTCRVYYNKEIYNTFKNPFHCNDCGRKLRTTSHSKHRQRLNAFKVYI